MKGRVFSVLGIIFALALCGTPVPANADIYGTNVKWDHTNIDVKVHASEVGAKRVKQGIGYWEVTNLTPRVTGGSCLDSVGIPQGCVDISDGAVFADPSWVAAAERYTLPDGTIYGCTIQYSGDYYWGSGSSLRIQVDDVATHEGGHCFGHAHTTDPSIPSVMQPTVQNWDGLQQYDIDEDRILYPFQDTTAVAGNAKHSTLRVERFVITK